MRKSYFCARDPTDRFYALYQSPNTFSDLGAWKRHGWFDATSGERWPIRPTMWLTSHVACGAYAGASFGNAGVHLPHGMSYPASGIVRGYRAPGYVAAGHAMVPHEISLIVNAPAAFSIHLSGVPGSPSDFYWNPPADISRTKTEDAGKFLADQLLALM